MNESFYKVSKNSEYWMGMASQVATRSKDPSSQVGAVIVDPDGLTVSTGFNGFIQGCDESVLSWERPDKYFYVIHAEQNSILFSGKRFLPNHTLYCTHSPCVDCLKHILQAKIRNVYYSDNSIMKRTSMDANRAIVKLIHATRATVLNVNNGLRYEDEIKDHYRNVEDFLL